MTRSTEFDGTVKHGMRAVQPDMVIHARRRIGRDDCGDDITGPRVGLIIAKSVGSAVERHRVARRLRHVVRTLLGDLDRCEQVVIRALPGTRQATSARLESQVRTGLRRVHASMGSKR